MTVFLSPAVLERCVIAFAEHPRSAEIELVRAHLDVPDRIDC